jgi:hypothetical protein
MLETDAIVEMLETHKAERLSSFTAKKRDSEGDVQSQATFSCQGFNSNRPPWRRWACRQAFPHTRREVVAHDDGVSKVFDELHFPERCNFPEQRKASQGSGGRQ